MKKFVLAIIALSGALATMAQTDSTSQRADTVRVGGMIIIKKKGPIGEDLKDVEIKKDTKRSKVSTNWGIVDLGFANFRDQSNYAAAQASGFTGAGIGKDQFDLRTGKSINVNIWFVMQRVSLIKRAVNLKYGLGLELNNYRFDDERVRLHKSAPTVTLDQSLDGVHKNKLAADYLTVPMMLDFNFTPKRKKGFGLAAGVSAGYLYSSRQKIKDGGDTDKLHDNFDLRKFKLAYVGELSLGAIRFYGSYAMKSMWEKGLDQTPYTVGLRLSSW